MNNEGILFHFITLTSAILVQTASPIQITSDAIHELPNGEFQLELDLNQEALSCTLERFQVTDSGTQFVIGQLNKKDTPYEFDTNKVTLLRGNVNGMSQSHVVVAMYKDYIRGSISISGARTIQLSDTKTIAKPSARPPELSMCGIGQENQESSQRSIGGDPTPPNQYYKLKQAVETDFEYRQLFETTEDAAAYVVLCFGLISDIYERDANTFVELTYVRLWEDEDDLFNQESPLNAFREYWNKNMQEVDRNLAQFFSGRSNLPYGGVAYIEAINEDWGYSVVGYLMGFCG